MYPAQNGDAFLLSTGRTNILIDGGYASTFYSYIQKDLEELAAKNACLNLVIITHIDADHIGGIICLLASYGDSDLPPRLDTTLS
nr:MBL fold metallo-hydrolase [Klebsiella quasipneumoniae]